MFNANKMQLIRSSCLPEFETFLKKISVDVPNWNNGDEFKIYRELDGEITKKICRLMKSSSIIDGYTKLLDLGGISYDFSESDNELLEKIISNKEKILQGGMVEKTPQPIQKPIDKFEIKISHAGKFSVEDLLTKISRLENLLNDSVVEKKSRFTNGKVLLPKNFSAMKYELSELRNYVKNLELLQVERRSVTVPLENLAETMQEYSSAFVEVKKFSQPVRQTEQPKIIFSPADLKNIFEVLEQVNKINKFI